jgi:hypothetical protein
MLRQLGAVGRLGTGLLRSITTSAARLEGEAAPAGVKEFTEAWQKTAPSTLALPELPTNFLQPEAGETAADGERFPVNFFTPHGVVAQVKVRRARRATGAAACSADLPDHARARGAGKCSTRANRACLQTGRMSGL